MVARKLFNLFFCHNFSLSFTSSTLYILLISFSRKPVHDRLFYSRGLSNFRTFFCFNFIFIFLLLLLTSDGISNFFICCILLHSLHFAWLSLEHIFLYIAIFCLTCILFCNHYFLLSFEVAWSKTTITFKCNEKSCSIIFFYIFTFMFFVVLRHKQRDYSNE